MITGAHVVLFTRDAEADRAFFRDVLDLPHVDAGHDWLIFRLPPAEVAVHPTDGADSDAVVRAEFYLVVDDVHATIADLRDRGYECAEARDEGWGVLTSVRLPSGQRLGLYEARHPTAFHLE